MVPPSHLFCRLASEYPRTAAFQTTDHLSKTGKKATLQLPDGRVFALDVMTPSYGTEVLVDIRNLYRRSGNQLLVYDPGFDSVASCASAISYLDSDTSTGLYRGYSVTELTECSDILSVAHLLVYGELPFNDEARINFHRKVQAESLLHSKLLRLLHEHVSHTHPMAIVASLLSSMASFYADPMDPSYMTDSSLREKASIQLLAKIPTLVALAFRHFTGEPFVYPREELGFAENFLNMIFATPLRPYVADPLHIEVLDKFLILHADHEQNASTTTVRVAGSSLANPFACIATGVTSLWGRAHGGASEAVIDMLEEIGSPSNVASFLDKVKRCQSSVCGFGHRVYGHRDPRVAIMRDLSLKLIDQAGNKDLLLRIALELEAVTAADAYFVQRNWFPNIDFYSGFVLRALGLPREMFAVMFAMARSVGWIAHWKEMVEEYQFDTARPRQLYVGLQPRSLTERERPEVQSNSDKENEPEAGPEIASELAFDPFDGVPGTGGLFPGRKREPSIVLAGSESVKTVSIDSS